MNLARAAVIAWAGVGLASGCDEHTSVGHDVTADVAGKYSFSITSGRNGCAFENWTEGAVNTGVTLTIAQTGVDVTANVEGIAALLLSLGYGSSSYVGQVDGHRLTMVLYSNKAMQSGNCSYTINSNILAEVRGDLISGKITYAPATNGNPDCAALACETIQTFNGARSPAPAVDAGP